jgi:hypothetical protein
MRLVCLYQAEIQIQLSGDRSSLVALGEALTAGDRVNVKLEQVPPDSYDGAFEDLVDSVTSGPVAIRHDGRAVTIEGGAEQIALLGQNISRFAEGGDPSDPLAHIHLEHISDCDHYIAADALPLIVSFWRRRRNNTLRRHSRILAQLRGFRDLEAARCDSWRPRRLVRVLLHR